MKPIEVDREMPDRSRLSSSWRVRAFGTACGGNITLIFAFSLPFLLMAGGGGIDLMRAFQARQKLSEVATLACQYASRPSVVQMASANSSDPNAGANYKSAVNNYIAAALQSQKFNWTQTNAAPFTYTTSGPGDVRLTAAVPTAFSKIVRINQIPISSAAHCYDSPSTIQQTVPQNDSPYVAKEGFEAMSGASPNGNGYRFYTIPGRNMGSPTSNPGSTPSYTGSNGTAWYGTGYCLETDDVGVINSSVPEGQKSAELDCDNGSGSAGNSAISTKVYLPLGNYELRYNFRSRVGYPNYDPAYLCGSAASDLSWANDTVTSSGYWVPRTNQINVYLDRNTSGSPPLHTTIDGSQQLAGSSLIDMCVQSVNWIERSVRIYVSTPAYYWLTFAADGQNDSYGGQIDNIRLCIKTCPGTLQDDFPTAWLPSSNGGINKGLFEDTFESPAYNQDPYISFNRTKGGNLANSTGTTGTSQSGWPGQSSSGWATGPYNQVNVWLQDAYQGRQHVSMQGWSGFSTGTDTLNRLISRKFLLDPGYYNVSYNYLSMVDFGAGAGIYGTFCTTAPNSGSIYPNNTTTYAGRPRYTSSNVAVTVSTNILGVFMSNGQLVSTLNANTATGNASNGQSATTTGGQASYTNPDGTVTTTPTTPPDRVNWASYDASANNPVIDTCGYAASYTWVPRSANVKVTKPGWYWLTFSAQGDEVTGTGNGPAIDDVKLTALGSPYLSSPPSVATAIPVPSPQPDTRIYFDGFYIVANPFIAPAPLQ